MRDDYRTQGTKTTMMAVVTTGNGGYDRLVYREVPIPALTTDELLLRVLAAGVNNTEINTRVGWYSAAVRSGTEDAALKEEEEAVAKPDGGWDKATPFPFIQGTDCCGLVVEVAPGGNEALIGKRVLVRPCIRPLGFGSIENIWMGSDFDGAFAQFVKVPSSEVFAVDCEWSDAELATIPCSYGTAENLLHRAKVGAGSHVLITGASGGVGSAAVQLAKRRGARVTGVAGEAKIESILSIGADRMIPRGDDILAALGEDSVDVVVDIVGGDTFGAMLQVLNRGGTYVTSGAIGGPLVTLDMRTLYLKDLTMIGTTAWDEPVFPNLISYIENGEIRPLLAKTFPMQRIVDAQREFMEKRHVGKFALIPAGVPD
jgi:NADPH:quinone reductase-like Zn-dependent oxidoreductase